jgi:hypothetical protein
LFSHAGWFDLAESLQVDLNKLMKEEWVQISLLNEDELQHYSNVPVDIAKFYCVWSAKVARPFASVSSH